MSEPSGKETLSRNAIHALIQPLTTISGYAEILCRKLPEGSEEHKFAETILAEATRLTKLINELRDEKELNS